MPLDATPPIPEVPQEFNCNTQDVIRPLQTAVEGCPVLPKLQCHEIQMGQRAQLLWNFKSPQGKPVNLVNCAGSCSFSTASGEPFDAGGTPGCGVTLRLREVTGVDPINDQVVSVAGAIVDPVAGLVRAEPLPSAIVRAAGLYLEEWAFFDNNGDMLFSNQCYLFVNRGLFGLNSDPFQQNLGPPTLSEIRLSLRDNAAADNTLLDAVEFDAAEIAQAVIRPIQHWNETPPPLRPPQTTKTFPFREMWLLGIQTNLLETAANHYRRNRLNYTAGGISVDDKNKEAEYKAAATQLRQQFQEMLRAKKMEINLALFSGTIGSPYQGMFYT